MALTHRLQLLLDEDRYARLQREAQRSGRSIASLIREAIDRRFGPTPEQRRAAVDRFLAAEPMPVDDWDVMKKELRDTFFGDAG